MAYENQGLSHITALTIPKFSKLGYLRSIYSTINSKTAI